MSALIRKEIFLSFLFYYHILNWQMYVWFKWLQATPEGSFHLLQLMPEADLIYIVFTAVQLHWRSLASCSVRLHTESSTLEVISDLSDSQPLALFPPVLCACVYGLVMITVWSICVKGMSPCSHFVTGEWVKSLCEGGEGVNFRYCLLPWNTLAGVVSTHIFTIKLLGFKWVESCQVLSTL